MEGTWQAGACHVRGVAFKVAWCRGYSKYSDHKEWDMLGIRLKKKWMDTLAQAFTIVDASVAQGIVARKQVPACSKGCYACCSQKIPLTIMEVMAIKEYLKAERVAVSKDGSWCPFLVDGACGVYSVRPIACRRYIVFNTQCVRNEDPCETRPGDVLEPSRKALVCALELTRPFYEEHGVWPQGENGEAPFFTTFCVEIRSVDW